MKRLLRRALFLIVVCTASAAAQRSLPFSDDALVLGFGQVRAGVHGSWEFYDQVYAGNGTAMAYGSPFSFANAGSAQFPGLAGNESAIRAVSNQNAFALSLGAANVEATHRAGTTALLLDFGLPGRLMISAEIPFVRVETAIRVSANSDPSGANVGLNPALTSTTAFAADTSLANQISRARTALSAQLASCAGSSASSCATVNARRTEAQTLVTTSATMSTNLLLLATSSFVPLATTATYAAIQARIAAITAAYRDFGITSVTGSSLIPAAVPITGGQYRDFLANSSIGLGGSLPAFRSFTRLGDINVTAKFRITETQKLRAAGFGRVYFPTGGKGASTELLPVLAGQGSTRVEAGGIADIFLTNRVYVTASGAGLFAMSDSSGTGFRISVAPGYAFNKWMTVGAQYQGRTFGDATEHRIGAGISFSNLGDSMGSGPRFPVEATFVHSQGVSGSGLQPKIFSDEFRVRFFARR